MDSDSYKKNIDDVLASFNRGSSKGDGMKPSDKVELITKVFNNILGREPDTRDLNYYKYSSLSEKEIREELINSKEHKSLLKNGREYVKVKKSLDATTSKVRILESDIKDQKKSFEELNVLLKEKNIYINELREKLKSPFELKCPVEKKEKAVKSEETERRGFDFKNILDKFLSIFNS